MCCASARIKFMIGEQISVRVRRTYKNIFLAYCRRIKNLKENKKKLSYQKANITLKGNCKMCIIKAYSCNTEAAYLGSVRWRAIVVNVCEVSPAIFFKSIFFSLIVLHLCRLVPLTAARQLKPFSRK